MQTLRIALQKKGRLNQDSIDLLTRCGLKFRVANNALITRCENLPIDLLWMRDDDIPTMVMDGVCDLGIVGENALFEKQLAEESNTAVTTMMKLGFSRCRLAMAAPQKTGFSDRKQLNGLRIATSYPNLLKEYLQQQAINAHIITLSGSVEIAPRLNIADAICDLVSTGRTLEENQLAEIDVVMRSQAVFIQSQQDLSAQKKITIELLLTRMRGVIKAKESKYILFHIEKNALEEISRILPSCETPTIVPLDGHTGKVAVHLVSPETIFWDTLEKLKAVGASAILVLPIEKMMS